MAKIANAEQIDAPYLEMGGRDKKVYANDRNGSGNFDLRGKQFFKERVYLTFLILCCCKFY
jgi:hypothetical protein